MKIGVEVEFFLNNSNGTPYFLNGSFLRENRIYSEYYNGMYEVTFLFNNTVDKAFIYKKLKSITDTCRNTYIPLKSVLIPIPDGAASCGVHIHVDMDLIKDPDLMEMILVYDKFRKNPSLRFLHSHHIWGALRPYSRDWKIRSRFRPLAYSGEREDKPETWEIRIYDLEDIWNGVLDSGINIIKQVSQGRKIPPGLLRKAEDTWKKLIKLNAEAMFGYKENIDRESAEFLYKILNKKCPKYRVIGHKVNIKPRFYSLTSLDEVAINEVIFDLALAKEKEEVSVCAV